MNRYDNFIIRLSEVPSPSEEMYSRIEREINRQRSLKRTAISIAAALILAVGVFFVFEADFPEVSSGSPEPETSSAVASELEYVADYLNGNTIEEEYNLYSVNTIVQTDY